MATEIELKFSLLSSMIAPFLQRLQHYSLKVLPPMTLINCYYDTAGRDLWQHSCGLRVRTMQLAQQPTQFELTLKCDRQTLAGLHQRAEYNVALTDADPNLAVLPSDALSQTLNRSVLQSQLQPLFETNFQRQAWLITYQQSQIEVVLDQGVIIAGTAQLPLLEVELELKQGQTAALLDLASELAADGLRLAEQSKAARGYALVDQLNLTPVAAPDLTALAPAAALQQLLSYWQQQEEIALVNQNIAELRKSESYLLQQLPALISQYDLDVAKQASFTAQLQQWQQLLAQANLQQLLFSPLITQLKLALLKLLADNQP